jgi:putative hydrolase of the HAD superfamily
MKIYKTLFFDLDGTLWDLKKNTEITLQELWLEFDLANQTTSEFSKFYQRYVYHNDRVWALYRDNKIEKEVLRIDRFVQAFADIKVTPDGTLIEKFADIFIERCPQKPHLLPGAKTLLEACHKKYPMHIITNGFCEIQQIKMKAAGIAHYFDGVIYSEDLGIKKPHRGIFDLALQRANTSVEDGLMIGDDWDADIIGAMNVGMDQAYLATTEMQLNEIRQANGQKPLRHNRKPTYALDSIADLKPILLG